MEDVTIIIQGKLLQDSYDFYISNYRMYPVIISTWTDCKIDFSNIPNNFIVMLSPLPKDAGAQNLNYQLVSTLNALKRVTTSLVIKIRGDEYFSNLESIYEKIKIEQNKIHTSPIFFRAWDFVEYHISDHIIAGTKERLMVMFRETKKNVDTGEMNVSKWKLDGKFHRWVTTHSPEERITKSYLNAIEPLRYDVIDGRVLMKEHFDILDLKPLKPYRIKANLFQAEWKDKEFIPEENYSISTIQQLDSIEPYKIPE
jgi:hypothetical protein